MIHFKLELFLTIKIILRILGMFFKIKASYEFFLRLLFGKFLDVRIEYNFSRGLIT